MQRVLAGRGRELEELTAGLEDALLGCGRIFLLSGEPGIGKTRLASEVAALAGQRGALTVWGRCWESGGAPAYWPWIQVLRGCLRGAGAGALGDAAALLPELRGAAPSTEGEARFRLFDAAAGFLKETSRRQPLVIIVDDLHAADVPSLHLLHFLARELADVRILVVGSYREVEVRLDPEVGGLLARVAREGTRIPLRRLGPDEVASVVAARAPAPSARTLEWLCEVTGGNPLFLEEILRLLDARGGLAGGAPSYPVITEGVIEAIRGHLENVGAETRGLLEIASVIGGEWATSLLAAVSGWTTARTVEALAEAALADIIVGAEAGRHRFAHALMREALYRGLAAGRRAALHLEVASALERDRAGSADVAHHLVAAAPAGDLGKAVACAARAAEEAMRIHAHEQAALHLERALAVLDLQGALDDERRFEILVALGEARTAAGEIRKGKEACGRAAEVARRLARPELLARAALGMGAEFLAASVDATLVALLEEALTALPGGDSGLRARLLARLASAREPSRTPARSLALGREAVAMARRVGDPATLAATIYSARGLYRAHEFLDERLALDREAVELFGAGGDVGKLLRTRGRLVLDLLECGDVAGFTAELAAFAELARQTRHPRFVVWVLTLQCASAVMRGRFAEADQLLDEIRHRAAGFEDLLMGVGQLAFMNLGRLVAQTRTADVLAFEAEMTASVGAHALRTSIQAMASVYIHAIAGARERAREGLDALMAGLGDSWPAPTILAEVCALVGDPRHAARALAIIEPYAAQIDGAGVIFAGSIARVVAGLECVLGRWDAAEADFAQALAMNERLGARPFIARTLVDEARMRLTRKAAGDAERASELLIRARAIAEELAMEGLLAEIDGLGAPPVARAVPAAVPVDASRSLRREGDIWAVAAGASTFRLRDSKGIQLLAELLGQPGVEIDVLDLLARVNGGSEERVALGDAGPLLDATAKAAYRERLASLREEEDEAEAWGDPARAARARAQLELIAEELARGVGLGGRDRVAASAVERARVNVQRRISDAVKKIHEHSPELGRVLAASLKTGTFCSYSP